MSAPDSRAALDTVLTIQLVVAYAGESCPDKPRLAWWDTDIVSRDGGLDLLRRLYPRTWRWAALRAVRATARAIDHAARKLHAAEPDHIVSLFHLGFALDEALDDHLDQLAATHPEDPTQALPDLPPLVDLDGRRAFDRKAFEAWLGAPPPPRSIESTAIGRRLLSPASPSTTPPLTSALLDHVLALRAALAPLPATYPLPYFHLKS